MARPSVCPDAPRLQRFLLGQLSEPEAEEVEQHLQQCSSCGTSLEALRAGDRLTETIRNQQTVADGAEQGVVEGLVRRLKELRLPAVPPAAEATEAVGPGARPPADETAELHDFLAPPQGAGEIGRLGGYRVLKVLGAGGMDVVFQAEDPQLRRLVALKAMRPALAASPSASQRFLREAQATAALKHDHVITIYQVGQERGVPFLAMELLEGESLDDRLKREGRLPLADGLRIGREIAAGLAAAHARGLVHRDIKPANVWLEAETGRVKTLDFGLARAAGGDSQLTQSGAIVGTPAYMAPEQARGEPVDARCDLFSLGCVLYRLCTGELPFRGKDTMSTLLALATEHPRPSRDLNPDVPPALNHLIQRLLAKDAADRPATAQAVVTALQAIEQGPAQPTPPPPATTTRTPRPSRRRRRPAVAAALLLLLAPLVYFFAPTVLRIATNKGLLVIETEDAAVEVIVNGQAARILDPHSKREIEVSAGEQEIVVKEMPDGLRFVTKKLTLTRGGKGVVRAGLELAQTVKAVPKNETKIEGGEPLSALALVQRPARIEGVRSWSLETRRQRAGNRYLYSAVNKDNQVAAAGADGTIRVWDPAREQLVRVLISPTGQINGLSWSPDGKHLAAAGDGVVTQWDVPTGRVVRTTPLSGYVSDVAWSPDGKYLAACANVLRVWEAESGRFIEVAEGQGAALVAWSPDGSAVAAARNNRRPAVWSIPAGKLVCTMTDERPAGSPTALAWSPDGKTVVTGEHGAREYQLWDPTSGKLLRAIKDPNHTMGRAAYSPDGKILALPFGPYNCINLYDVASGARLRVTGAWGQNMCRGLNWASGGKSLTASFDDSRLVTIDAATGTARHDVLPHQQPERAELSPDGRRLAVVARDVGLNDRRLHLWDLETAQSTGDVSLGGEWVSWISFSPDGQTLALAGVGGVKLHAAETGQLLRGCDDRPVRAYAVDWSPDGERLVVGCEDKTVRVYGAGSGKLLRTLEGHAVPVMRVAWTSDGKALASCGSDGKVRLWSPESGVCRHTLELGAEAFHMASSPDGKRLAAGSWEHARIWDTASGDLRASLSGAFLGWSADGKSANTVVKDGIRTWAADSGKLLRSVRTNTYPAGVHFGQARPVGAGRRPHSPVWPGGAVQLRPLEGGPATTLLALSGGGWLTVSPEGHYRGSPGVEKELVYVVQTDQGQETLAPEEFARRYNWKNDPDKERIAEE